MKKKKAALVHLPPLSKTTRLLSPPASLSTGQAEMVINIIILTAHIFPMPQSIHQWHPLNSCKRHQETSHSHYHQTCKEVIYLPTRIVSLFPLSFYTPQFFPPNTHPWFCLSFPATNYHTFSLICTQSSLLFHQPHILLIIYHLFFI